MKKPIIFTVTGVIILIGIVSFTRWGFSERIIDEMKARGFIEYKPEEAVELATIKCTQCHDRSNIDNYCDRCGPPFVVVVHQMKKYALPEMRKKYPDKPLTDITDAQAIAITQVWNSSIGNWEDGWRKEDLEKLLEGDQPLIKLLYTTFEDRKIESVLSERKMSPSEKYQKELMGMK